MIKLENAGLQAPRKISLGSGLHSQKSIRAPVSKMIGLHSRNFRAPGLQGTPLWDPVYATACVYRKLYEKITDGKTDKILKSVRNPPHWGIEASCK